MTTIPTIAHVPTDLKCLIASFLQTTSNREILEQYEQCIHNSSGKFDLVLSLTDPNRIVFEVPEEPDFETQYHGFSCVVERRPDYTRLEGSFKSKHEGKCLWAMLTRHSAENPDFRATHPTPIARWAADMQLWRGGAMWKGFNLTPEWFDEPCVAPPTVRVRPVREYTEFEEYDYETGEPLFNINLETGEPILAYNELPYEVDTSTIKAWFFDPRTVIDMDIIVDITPPLFRYSVVREPMPAWAEVLIGSYSVTSVGDMVTDVFSGAMHMRNQLSRNPRQLVFSGDIGSRAPGHIYLGNFAADVCVKGGSVEIDLRVYITTAGAYVRARIGEFGTALSDRSPHHAHLEHGGYRTPRFLECLLDDHLFLRAIRDTEMSNVTVRMGRGKTETEPCVRFQDIYDCQMQVEVPHREMTRYPTLAEDAAAGEGIAFTEDLGAFIAGQEAERD